jgi:hypothetical protein
MIMTHKEEITAEMIEGKIKELTVLLSKYEYDDRADLAAQAIFEVVNTSCYDHYHGVGILMESVFRWRCISDHVEQEEHRKENKKDEDDKNNNSGGKVN